MEYSQIKYVLSVAETKNFSRSAELLFITQPTLSQQIGRLERELGFRLFERTTRSVLLTDAGAAFVEDAKTVVEAWNSLAQTAQRQREGGVTRIVVGLLPTLGRTDLAEGISGFAAKYTNVQVDYVMSYSYDLLSMLNRGAIDVGIVNTLPFSTRNTDGCDISKLEDNPIMVVLNGRHPLRDREKLTLDDIRSEPVVALSGNASVRLCMDHVFRRNHIEPRIACECDAESLADLVAANVGISFLTRRVAAKQRDLVVLPLHPPVVTHTSVVIKKGRIEEPIIGEFKRHIISSFKSSRLIGSQAQSVE